MESAEARAQLDAAEAARAAAEAQCGACRAAAATAGANLAEMSMGATVSQNKLETQQSELQAATDRLARDRATVGDAELAAAADTATQAARAAGAGGAEAGARAAPR